MTLIRASAFLGCALAGGTVLGLLTAVASDSLFLLGLWPLAAALAGAFGLVSAAHLLRQRGATVHLAAAALLAMAWVTADRAGEAWLFRLHQIDQVARSGLLLADHAVLHDSDNPDELVDAALLAETGAAGVLGAARVQLRGGVPVLRVLRSTRVIHAPLWGHVLWLALRATLVALVAARALEQLRHDPVCAMCGAWLRREELGWVTETAALGLQSAWRAGERTAPLHAGVSGDVQVLQDRCPHGHSTHAGYELRRPRGRALARRTPGPVARLPPLT